MRAAERAVAEATERAADAERAAAQAAEADADAAADAERERAEADAEAFEEAERERAEADAEAAAEAERERAEADAAAAADADAELESADAPAVAAAHAPAAAPTGAAPPAAAPSPAEPPNRPETAAPKPKKPKSASRLGTLEGAISTLQVGNGTAKGILAGYSSAFGVTSESAIWSGISVNSVSGTYDCVRCKTNGCELGGTYSGLFNHLSSAKHIASVTGSNMRIYPTLFTPPPSLCVCHTGWQPTSPCSPPTLPVCVVGTLVDRSGQPLADFRAICKRARVNRTATETQGVKRKQAAAQGPSKEANTIKNKVYICHSCHQSCVAQIRVPNDKEVVNVVCDKCNTVNIISVA